MFVTEVAAMFRAYADEQDKTFLTDAQVSQYCRLGYDDFYRIVQKTSPESILVNVNIAFPTPRLFYDLADPANTVRLLGASLTHKRLLRLYRIGLVDPTTGLILMLLEAANSAEELQAAKGPAANVGFFPFKYFFSGTILNFAAMIQQTVQVSYIPFPSKTPEFAQGIDWSKIAPADTERIDDFQDFHELIALFAMQRYAIRDGADNQQLQRQLSSMRNDFVSYLTSGRNLDALHVSQSW